MKSDDLISRQEAILDAVNRIRVLPSAEPKIIHCKDCKWFGQAGCAISIVDDTDSPKETDFCSFAERAEE